MAVGLSSRLVMVIGPTASFSPDPFVPYLKEMLSPRVAHLVYFCSTRELFVASSRASLLSSCSSYPPCRWIQPSGGEDKLEQGEEKEGEQWGRKESEQWGAVRPGHLRQAALSCPSTSKSHSPSSPSASGGLPS
uniref:Uncharacterized protein n=1 Tax=Oryza punctata TaxID=4537 RepID=A0A0E0LWM8_ORYPU